MRSIPPACHTTSDWFGTRDDLRIHGVPCDRRIMPAAPATTSICELTPGELERWCAEQGEHVWRAGQIQAWLYGKRARSFDEMHDLPTRLRRQISSDFSLFASELVAHRVSADRTEKLLLKFHDGQAVECVLMRQAGRRTVCISSQAGCAMGCVFCASGLGGLKRNLSSGEILEQILRIDRLLPRHERITNIVVMGVGEPLANLTGLLPAIDIVTHTNGLALGARRITISTVGLPDRIRDLAAIGKPYNLAVSLHAPNDKLRSQLVPVNDNIGIEAILEAADEFFAVTGRRVSWEYVLLGGINDHDEHARQLARLLRHRNGHVNLIPMNAVAELPFGKPAAPRTRRFLRILADSGIVTTVRKRKGADIDAACGQLRLTHAVEVNRAGSGRSLKSPPAQQSDQGIVARNR